MDCSCPRLLCAGTLRLRRSKQRRILVSPILRRDALCVLDDRLCLFARLREFRLVITQRTLRLSLVSIRLVETFLYPLAALGKDFFYRLLSKRTQDHDQDDKVQDLSDERHINVDQFPCLPSKASNHSLIT